MAVENILYDIILASMTPQDYRQKVLHDLSLEQRESLMIDKKHRMRTFEDSGWTLTGPLRPEKLAAAGLYYLGKCLQKMQQSFSSG